jgi:type IV pilus assembly protein PilB
MTELLAKTKDIAGVLVNRGLLTKEQASNLKTEEVTLGRPLEKLIEERKLVSVEDLTKAKAEVLGISYTDLTGMDISADLLNLVPKASASRYHVIPFAREGATLSVAMSDPLDLQAIQFLERQTGLKIKPTLAEKEEIEKAIESQYQKALGEEVEEALREVAPQALKLEEAEEIKQPEMLRKFPVADVVNSILKYAAKSRASDVHIEPTDDRTRVRYRIDGILQERLPIPRELHSALISRIKILSNLKIDETRVPQDGRFKIEYEKRTIDLRVSTMPTALGEKTAIRLLEETAEIPDFSKLGMRGVALKRMEEVLTHPIGIIYITGPTGSGKTLTLAAALSKINTPKVNIITLEDPVEIRIPGINQTQINVPAGLTFAKGLRSILRQDPDVIMVGETRDNETAALSIHAALTGHLVFSTLHTNSAAAALPRLIDMEVEPFLLTSTVEAIQAQRLVRKICSECRQEYKAPEQAEEKLKKILGSLYEQAPKTVKKKKLTLFKGGGKGAECDKCGGSGYSGRTGIFEVLKMSDTIGRLVLEHRPSNEVERQAVKEGMVTLVQDGFLKVLEGVTTIEEVLRVAEEQE